MARTYDAAIPGLNRLLRDLRGLPKEAQAELRTASQQIAERRMVPAWQYAARAYAGPWGDRIAESVRARRDRVPVVVIGGKRRVFSGGATPNEVRYPAHRGTTGRAGQAAAMFGTGTGWIDRVDKGYIGGAMQEWAAAVSGVCRDFNRGGRI